MSKLGWWAIAEGATRPVVSALEVVCLAVVLVVAVLVPLSWLPWVLAGTLVAGSVAGAVVPRVNGYAAGYLAGSGKPRPRRPLHYPP